MRPRPKTRNRDRLLETGKTGEGRASMVPGQLEQGNRQIAAIPADDAPGDDIRRRGPGLGRAAHFISAGELRRLLRDAGGTRVTARHGLYLPSWDTPALVDRASTIERLGRSLGRLGAAFVVVRAELPER